MAWGSQLAAGTASAITQNINSRYDMVKKVSDEIEKVVIVSDNIEDVNTTAENITDIKSVVADMDKIGAVSEDMPTITKVADDINNINTVADNIVDVDTVSTNIGSVVSAAESIFPASSTPPTTRPNGDPLVAGDEYFDTTIGGNRTWNGSEWIRGGGQASDVGTSKGYGIGYTVSVSAVEDIVITSGTNGFSIDNFELADGATLTIEDGATYKII